MEEKSFQEIDLNNVTPSNYNSKSEDKLTNSYISDKPVINDFSPDPLNVHKRENNPDHSTAQTNEAIVKPYTNSATSHSNNPVVSRGNGQLQTGLRDHNDNASGWYQYGVASVNMINNDNYAHYNNHKSLIKDGGSPYARGDLIVTVSPENHSCVWVTPAKFNVHRVPPEFLDPKLSITADDFNMAMEFLTNDYRFNCYNMCYRRIIVFWLFFGLFILLAILFSGMRGTILFGMGIVWLLVNTIGIFMCLLIKKRMNNNLDDAVSAVNRVFIKKNVLAGMEDKGKISCHKISISFFFITDN
ncbi:unnamed protein product [Gordionus sp. m RMFG-2023]